MQAAILTFILPVITVLFTGVFLALWWSDRENKPALAFTACFGSIVLGIALNIWLTSTLVSFGVVAYHLLAMGGMLCLMWGVAERAKVKAPLLISAISVVIVTPMLWFAVEVGAPDAMKLLQNTNSAAITAFIAVTLWYGTKRNRADYVLMWSLAGLAGFGFVRPSLTLFVSAIWGMEGVGPMVLTAIHVLVLSTLLSMIAFSLIASLILDKMQSDHDEATLDGLTGLPLRSAFSEQAVNLLGRALSERIPVSLIVADIDHFKEVNDTFGHSAGDDVIKAFANVISSKIRPGDVAGRVGGEEFCILAWNCSEEGACALAERLRNAFAEIEHPVLPDGQMSTASFGVAYVKRGEAFAQTFNRADAALYHAKHAGRNCVIGHRIGDFSKKDNTNEKASATDQEDSAKILNLPKRQAVDRS